MQRLGKAGGMQGEKEVMTWSPPNGRTGRGLGGAFFLQKRGGPKSRVKQGRTVPKN